MVRGAIARLFRRLDGLLGFLVVRRGVACAVRVGHRVAAEVFEVFLHPLHEDDGLLAVGVEQRVGVGEHHHGGVGHIARGADGDGDGYYQVGAITYGAYAFNQANDAILGVHPEYGIYLNQETLSFNRPASEGQVWFSTCDTSSAPWTATSVDNRITVSGTGFSHLGQVTIAVSENNTGEERTGRVVFAQGSLSVTVTVIQNAYDPATDYCPLTVEMENTHGEPWAGDAYLSFESTGGSVYGVARHTASSHSSTATVNVAPHDVMVRWHPGGALDRYINYKIKNRFGEVLVDVQNAYFDGSDVLLPWPCNSLGIENQERPSVSVYPNPTSGIVTVSGLQPTPSGATIIMYDATGHAVLETVKQYESAATVNIQTLPSGVYFLRVLTPNGVYTSKVVKE